MEILEKKTKLIVIFIESIRYKLMIKDNIIKQVMLTDYHETSHTSDATTDRETGH